MNSSTVFSVLLILLGPAIGSFLAVLADRLPRNEDVLLKPSACRTCKQRLKVIHLLPIISFVRQRGRCSSCGASIPPFTLYAELLALGAGVLAVIAHSAIPDIALSAIWLWLLITLAISDAIWLRLPDLLTLLLFVCGLISSATPMGIGIGQALSGAAAGAGSFAALRWGYFKLRGRIGLGLGDVKLVTGLGAFTGPFDLPMLILIAAVSTLLYAILTRNHSEGLSKSQQLPFGTALCFGGAVIWLLNVPI